MVVSTNSREARSTLGRSMEGQTVSPLTAEITNGQKNECVHINWLHHCLQLQPDLESPVPEQTPSRTWQTPTVDHLVLPPAPRLPLTPARSLCIPRLLKGGASVAEQTFTPIVIKIHVSWSYILSESVLCHSTVV